MIVKLQSKEILNYMRTGREEIAFSWLYKHVYPKIVRTIQGKEFKNESEDIFQEAMMVLYKQVTTNKFDDRYEVEGFVFTVTKNLWLNRLKRKQKMVSVENDRLPQMQDSNILDHFVSEDRAKMVREMMNHLDAKCRELITFTVFQDLSMEDVCERMGFNSENAARVASHRCKKFLIDIVKSNPRVEKILQL